eukprot:Rhum_TRINITY_DN14440_c23_g1::Rhum_TRINITY_DN14440_c23_g1_i1::g.90701::m.90701
MNTCSASFEESCSSFGLFWLSSSGVQKFTSSCPSFPFFLLTSSVLELHDNPADPHVVTVLGEQLKHAGIRGEVTQLHPLDAGHGVATVLKEVRHLLLGLQRGRRGRLVGRSVDPALQRQLLLVLEPLHQARDRDVPLRLDHNRVPHRLRVRHRHLVDVHLHGGVEAGAALDGGRRGRLGLGEEREGKVAEGVAEEVCILLAHNLVQLQAHEAGGKRRGRGDGRDDPAGLQLGLEEVHLIDDVVPRAQVREGLDEVDVEVEVLVLLELVHEQRLRQRRRGERGVDGRARVVHLLAVVVAGLGLHLLRGGLAGLVRLRLHLRLEGLEGGDGHLLERLLEVRRVPLLALDVVHLRAQVGRRHEELHRHRVAAVELDHLREALGRRPERGAGVGGHVLGAVVHEQLHTVHEVCLVLLARPRDAVVERRRALVDDRVHQPAGHGTVELRVARQLVEDGLDVLVRLHQVVHERLAALRELVRVRRHRLEVADELGPGKAEAVVDVVREVVQRALGGLLLGGITGGAVVLGLEGHDALRVALRAEGAALEQGLRVQHALRVDVQARLHVVERVHHQVDLVPEGLREHVLRGGLHALRQGQHVEGRVHHLRDAAGALRLAVPDVVVAEEELPAEVALLDRVVVRHRRPPLVARDAHQREVLQELAAERARADQEDVEGSQLLLHRAAEHLQLRRVAALLVLLRQRRRHLRRQGLLAVVVVPLEGRVELARARLDHLLPHHASEDGRERVQHGAEAPCVLLDGRDAVVELLDARRVGQLAVQLARRGRRLRGAVGGGEGGGAEAVRRAEGEEGEAAAAELLLELRLAEVLEHGLVEGLRLRRLLRRVAVVHLTRLGEALAQRAELQDLQHLRLCRDAARDVLAERRRVRDLELLLALRHVVDLLRLAAVELRHALHLREGDVVAVVEVDVLVLHALHQRLLARLALLDLVDDRRLQRLARRVRAHELRTVVAEHVPEHAVARAVDEVRRRRRGGAARVVHHDRLLDGRVTEDHHRVSGHGLRRERRLLHFDGHGRVQLLELRLARRGAVLAHVLLGQVEVRAQVGRLHRLRVLQRHGLDVGEDHVLRRLGTQAVEAGDEDARCGQLEHALAAVHGHLPRLQVLIQLRSSLGARHCPLSTCVAMKYRYCS